MPNILGRTLFFEREENLSAEDLYQSLCQSLKAALAQILELPDESERWADWPNACLANAMGSVTVESSEWQIAPDTDEHGQKLLRIELAQHFRDYKWVTELRLGQLREEEIVLSEECSVSPYQPRLPLETMPDLLASLSKLAGKDQDGLQANGVYVVSSDRVGTFVDFVRSPERQLPVLLLSPIPGEVTYLLSDTWSIARDLQGLTHVIKLQDVETVQRMRSILPNHSCYDGAVRIFWPGFKDTDDPKLYPFWLPRRSRTARGELDIRQEVVAAIVERSPQIFVRNIEIEQLEQQQLAAEEKRRVAELEKRLGEQIQLRSQEDQELREWFKDYDRIERERNDLRQRNQVLESKVSELDYQVRKLRGVLNRIKLQGKQLPESLDEPSIVHRVILSSKAYRQYRSFDDKQQHYWDKHVLGKLLNEQLLRNLSEPIVGTGGTCWVYPRSGGAGGDRIIYYTEDERVYVCEMFSSDEHDREYNRLRNQGIDRAAYDGFEPWYPCEATENREH